MTAVSRLKTWLARSAAALLLAAPFAPVVALLATAHHGPEKQRTEKPQRRRQTKRLVLAHALENYNPHLTTLKRAECKNIFT